MVLYTRDAADLIARSSQISQKTAQGLGPEFAFFAALLVVWKMALYEIL